MDNNYKLGIYEKAMPSFLSIKEKLEIAKETHFDYMELSIDETDEKLERLNWNKQQRLQLLLDMNQIGIPIYSICCSAQRKYPLGSKNEETQRKSLEILEKTIELAFDLGIRIIQLAGYDVYYEKSDEITKQIFLKNLNFGSKLAAKYGILLGFETMETPFMDTVEKAMAIIEEIDSPFLHIYPDIGNLKNASLLYQQSVESDLIKGKGHLIAAHLKETRPGIYRNCSFGQGHTDFKENVSILKKLGVRCFVGEFWHQNNDDYKQDCLQSNSFLREYLNRVFND